MNFQKLNWAIFHICVAKNLSRKILNFFFNEYLKEKKKLNFMGFKKKNFSQKLL